jgi:hypothetical protein
MILAQYVFVYFAWASHNCICSGRSLWEGNYITYRACLRQKCYHPIQSYRQISTCKPHLMQSPREEDNHSPMPLANGQTLSVDRLATIS